MMSSPKILVTGGAGFVGSNLINQLIVQYPESKISVLDNLFTGSLDNLSFLDNENITLHVGSTEDIEYHFINESFDLVYHFGEYSRIVKSFEDVNYVMKTNLHGTTRVLEMCRKWGAKLIYSASSSKFGNDGKDENLSPYAWAKSKMVELIKNYGEWFDLEYEICYFFNVYGPGQITEGDYATVIGIFERQYNSGEPLTVVSPGSQSRDFTHVEDIITGIIRATRSGLNREWHLRSGKVHTILEVAGMFDHNWVMIPERRGERLAAEDVKTDTETKLDWKPKWDLNKYIKETVINVR